MSSLSQSALLEIDINYLVETVGKGSFESYDFLTTSGALTSSQKFMSMNCLRLL
jgi:hypothetical protein